jgi:hypothetical protein
VDKAGRRRRVPFVYILSFLFTFEIREIALN